MVELKIYIHVSISAYILTLQEYVVICYVHNVNNNDDDAIYMITVNDILVYNFQSLLNTSY